MTNTQPIPNPQPNDVWTVRTGSITQQVLIQSVGVNTVIASPIFNFKGRCTSAHDVYLDNGQTVTAWDDEALRLATCGLDTFVARAVDQDDDHDDDSPEADQARFELFERVCKLGAFAGPGLNTPR